MISPVQGNASPAMEQQTVSPQSADDAKKAPASRIQDNQENILSNPDFQSIYFENLSLTFLSINATALQIAKKSMNDDN